MNNEQCQEAGAGEKHGKDKEKHHRNSLVLPGDLDWNEDPFDHPIARAFSCYSGPCPRDAGGHEEAEMLFEALTSTISELRCRPERPHHHLAKLQQSVVELREHFRSLDDQPHEKAEKLFEDYSELAQVLESEYGQPHNHLESLLDRFTDLMCALRERHDRTHQHLEKLYKIPAGQLYPNEHCERVDPLPQTAFDQFRTHIMGEYFACLGARAAFAHGSVRVGNYKELGHPNSVLAHGRDLLRFGREYEQLGDFATFVSIFKKPQKASETNLELLMWKHLQELHNDDRMPWDKHYMPDPESPNFGYSIGGHAYFVVLIHPGASRYSRNLGHTILVFNPESQIHRLKREGKFEQFARQVRQREIRYQGSINPSLSEDPAHVESEARVYSGVPHPPGSGWKCPFKPKPEVLANHIYVPPDITPRCPYRHE